MWVAEQRGECGRHCGYPCKHVSMSSSLAVILGEMRGSERARVRDAIKVGFDEYENVPIDQHRHRGLWDLV